MRRLALGALYVLVGAVVLALFVPVVLLAWAAGRE